VLVQLACGVVVLRKVNRSVFVPRPRVDSALVKLQRTGPAPAPEVRGLVRAGFAHRRKTLAGSLELAGVASRAEVRRGLEEIGMPQDARAQALAPRQFTELAGALA
jgi:16S rRNA (adenine1518-N6/adenine1519-N6)-dimethyltransferase